MEAWGFSPTIKLARRGLQARFAFIETMQLPPQEQRTFFVTTVTWERRPLFQVERNAQLLLDVFAADREKGRYQIHAFVIMRDHLHLLLTPSATISLEKSIQFIKGGFSFRLKNRGEVWQRSFTEHRIRNRVDYRHHLSYIADNPVRAGLAVSPEKYSYSFVARCGEVDPAPPHLQDRG